MSRRVPYTVQTLRRARSAETVNDCLTTSFKGAMPQWVRVPIRLRNRGGHSHGRATLKNLNVVTS